MQASRELARQGGSLVYLFKQFFQPFRERAMSFLLQFVEIGLNDKGNTCELLTQSVMKVLTHAPLLTFADRQYLLLHLPPFRGVFNRKQNRGRPFVLSINTTGA